MIGKQQNTGLLILRLSIAILMLLHGWAKLTHGVDGIMGMVQAKGLPGFLAYGVYIGEIVAPLLILVGYRTRLASLVFVLNILVIIYVAHANDIFALTEHGGWKIELIGLFLFGALALFFTGAGKFALSSSNKWD